MQRIFAILTLMACSSIEAQNLVKGVSKNHMLDSKQAQIIIKDFEPFFKEAFAQQIESFKLKKDSITGAPYIDFCEYPPDRSLVFGALENGRFKGEKINDLPFTCNENSGAKKYFIYNKNIKQSFAIMKKLKFLNFLTNTPSFRNEIIQNNQSTITTLWKESNQQRINKKDNDLKQLWILYRNEAQEQSCTIIFTQKDTHTEIILQYLNYQ